MPDLWYFAYGSNLDPRTFLGRRRMQPAEALVALLREYSLVFDLPVGKGERAVANLLPTPEGSVYGVAYRISSAQALHLDRTEGAPRAYQRTAVEVESEPESRLQAFTYVSPHRREGRKPSARYLNLLLRGARHHRLPESYVHQLSSFELAEDERDPQLGLFGARDQDS